jgi:hypothetical protein
MNTPTTSTPPSKAPSQKPLVEQRLSIIFMLLLLVVSGVTATVVGYRVKSADIDRKSQLLKHYETLGGSYQLAHQLGTSVFKLDTPQADRRFVAIYQLNCRARAVGLYQVLETTPDAEIDEAIAGLYDIKATEGARSLEDAWREFRSSRGHSSSPKEGVNPKALRFAKQYDRYLARDAEVKLFRALRQN